MELTWSNTATQILCEINPWIGVTNMLGAYDAHIRLQRPWRDPPEAVVSNMWASPSYAEPLEIRPLIERIRTARLLLGGLETDQKLSKDQTDNMKLRLEPLASMTELSAALWDYYTRVVHATPYNPPDYLTGGSEVYGPYMPKPVKPYDLGALDGLTVYSPLSARSGDLAAMLWYMDSPMHDVTLLEVDAAELPVPPQGTLGQTIQQVFRNRKAADLVRLYRLQATIFELTYVWTYVTDFILPLAKKYGFALADELEAMAPIAEELLTYRHPLIAWASESTRRMNATTPDGAAKVLAVSPSLLKALTEQPLDGYTQAIDALRRTAVNMPDIKAVGPKEPPALERLDIFYLVQWLRPVLEQRGENMRKLASRLWKSKPGATPVELWFNKPPFGITDGISAGVSAAEVLLGFRQLVPLSSTGMRFDIARAIWEWDRWTTYPVEREDAPGEYIRPSDGFPKDVLPAALYMGEPGAVYLPTDSVVTRLRQVGMLEAAKGLVSPFGAWPGVPGDYGLSSDRPEDVTFVDEETGTYIEGDAARWRNVVLPGQKGNYEANLLASRFLVRPEGFATRAIARKAHPTAYYYVHGESIRAESFSPLWFADWPVDPKDIAVGRPFTAAVDALIKSTFPALSIK